MNDFSLFAQPTFSLTTKRTRNPNNTISRGGFTLVELLIVMSVIAVLGTLALLVIRGAVENAKADRTQSQITRINEILQQRWEDYEVRILPIRIPANAGLGRGAIAKIRSDAILQLVRAEMPNRASYVTSSQFPTGGFDVFYPALNGSFRIPSLYTRYNAVASPGWTEQHQEAECLYMVLQSIVVLDQSGVDFLHNDEVRDTDGDGMPEVLDGFGLPMQFKIFYDEDPDEELTNFVEVDDFETYFGFAQTYELDRLKFVVRSASQGAEDPL